MKKLYRFAWDFGRHGVVTGLFIEEEARVQSAIGHYAYFGEILGKHSDVEGELQEGDITVLTDDQAFIEKANELGIVPHGYNPLDHIEVDEDEDDGEGT